MELYNIGIYHSSAGVFRIYSFKKVQGRLSYKSKKRVKVADEDKIIFKNTHEAIVDEETWKIANKVKTYRKKTPYSVDPFNLTGFLYCTDCGAKLIRRSYNSGTGERYESDQAYCCSKYRQNTSDCTMHFIKRSDILELIKKSIQRASKYTITNEKEFREQILAELAVRQDVDTSQNAEVIANAEARMKELDTLIGKLYETYALEKISDRQYQRLMNQYEDEYGELEAMVEELVPDEEEQTPTMIHEFIDRVVVYDSNDVKFSAFLRVESMHEFEVD